MAEADETTKILTGSLDRKLTRLEEKALALEKEFEGIVKRTAEIELWTKQYETKVKEEKRLIGLLHTLVRPGDKRATILMNHLSVFFDEILTRLENRGMRYNNVKPLQRDIRKEEVSYELGVVLEEMNFTENEIKDLKLIIELIHSRIRRKNKLMGAYELHCSENDPALVPEEIKLYLQLRDELDEPMRTLLKKIVVNCYKESKEATGTEQNG